MAMASNCNHKVLLATKLTIPHTYAQTVVTRIRLYRLLEQSSYYPLLLLTAPAGFGQTTLLSSWTQDCSAQVIWVTLEKNDDDLVRFWRYCLAAFAQINHDLNERLQPFMQSWPSLPIENMLTVLINALVARPDEDILFILDDYHTINSPAVHQSLTFLLEHLPTHVHMIISTRIDPPLPLARLRVHGRLLELHAGDLRFNLEEAVEFLTHTMQLDLELEKIIVLQRNTEGWVAGLQLAALALKICPDVASQAQFIASFVGLHRSIAYYLTDEVLEILPVEMQDFLMMTSILPQMNLDLCMAVTELEQSDDMLEWLERADLLVTVVDEYGTWYRYHHILLELLRQHLRQCYNCELIATLHIRASRWYEQRHLLNEAVQHALHGNAFERAADLIERDVWPLWLQGKTPSIFDWLLLLRDRIEIEQRPIIAYLSSFLFLHEERLDEYHRALRIALDTWEAAQDTEMLSSVFDLQAYYALYRRDGTAALLYTQRALELNRYKPFCASSSHVFRGAACLYRGDIQQAQLELLSGQRVGLQTKRAMAVVSSLLYQGSLRAMQGQLHEALSCYLQCIDEAGACVIWFQVLAHMHAGQLWWEWNQLSQAQECLRTARQLCAHFWQGKASIDEEILAARLAWAAGNADQAQNILERAEIVALHLDTRRLDLAQIGVLRVQYWLAEKKIAQAQAWMEQMQLSDASQMGLLERELWCQVQARLLLAQKRPAEAIQILRPCLPVMKEQGRVAHELQIQLLLVQAYAALGATRRVKQTLEYLLVLAEPGGYQRLFLDEGQVMVVLLSDLYHRQQKRYSGDLQPHILGYVQTLLTAFGCAVEPRDWRSWQKRAQQAQASLAQLSERELEVLSLIAAGHSNQQMACTLVVAESTIKTHLNSIYSKLSVKSRLQALMKAHAVGLLKP
jgi:LuxR family transcriptional regulator, maltose regulon positive regulatory protein